MKKAIRFITSIVAVLLLALPATAFAQDNLNGKNAASAPVLTSISFENAQIRETFSPLANEYTIMLTDASVTPTLKDYKIKGDAKLFVEYSYDEAKQQNGIIVTLQYDSGTNVYTFNYVNAQPVQQSANNLLSAIECDLGEVYPKINDKDTTYNLYIPNDLTELKISAVTQDVGARCDVPNTIALNADQEPTIKITVTASNAQTRTYDLKIKRLNKTSVEVRAELSDPAVDSIVEGELFYQKPVFFISLCSGAGGILLLILFVKAIKKITIRVSDEDELTFFEE